MEPGNAKRNDGWSVRFRPEEEQRRGDLPLPTIVEKAYHQNGTESGMNFGKGWVIGNRIEIKRSAKMIRDRLAGGTSTQQASAAFVCHSDQEKVAEQRYRKRYNAKHNIGTESEFEQYSSVVGTELVQPSAGTMRCGTHVPALRSAIGSQCASAVVL